MGFARWLGKAINGVVKAINQAKERSQYPAYQHLRSSSLGPYFALLSIKPSHLASSARPLPPLSRHAPSPRLASFRSPGLPPADSGETWLPRGGSRGSFLSPPLHYAPLAYWRFRAPSSPRGPTGQNAPFRLWLWKLPREPSHPGFTPPPRRARLRLSRLFRLCGPPPSRSLSLPPTADPAELPATFRAP